MFKRNKYWKAKAEKAEQTAFKATFDAESSLDLLRRFVRALEVDGFGHVKDIHIGDATEIYHEYLDKFITKN